MELSKITDNLSIETVQRILEDFPYSPWQVAGAATGSYLVYKLATALKWWWIDPQFSPLRNIPGPDTYDSIIWGNMAKMFNAPPSKIHEEWLDEYGHTITYRGMFLVRRIMRKEVVTLTKISRTSGVPSMHQRPKGVSAHDQPQL